MNPFLLFALAAGVVVAAAWWRKSVDRWREAVADAEWERDSAIGRLDQQRRRRRTRPRRRPDQASRTRGGSAMTAAVDETVSTKRCTKCRQVKPLDAFGRDADGRLGLRAACKHCYASAYECVCRACGTTFRRHSPHTRCCSDACLDDYEQGPPVCVCDTPTSGWMNECATCRRPYGPRFAELRAAWRAHLVRNTGRAA